MMPTGWGLFPWPVLFVIPMMTMAVLIALRLSHHRGAVRPGCGFGASPTATVDVAAPPPAEDPMVVLRDRFARGEIDLPEFETRLEGLLRTDPNESILRQDLPDTAAAPRRTR